MAISPEMYRWWLNGYVLVTSLMTSQEEDLKDSSSPIITIRTTDTPGFKPFTKVVDCRHTLVAE